MRRNLGAAVGAVIGGIAGGGNGAESEVKEGTGFGVYLSKPISLSKY